MKAASALHHPTPSADEARADGASPYATIADPHRSGIANVTRRLLILFALVAGLVVACGLTYSIAWQSG
jgi:two-component system C4-dicarboxylate transport sensor histidine kinase DctB